MLRTVMAGLFLSLCAFSAANAQITGIAAGGVSAEISCEQAYAFQSSMASRMPRPTPDEILTDAAVASKCTAEEYNLAQAAAGAEKRVIAVGTVSGEGPTRSVAFDLVRVSAKDEAQLRMVCDVAGAVHGRGDQWQ